MVPCIKNVDFKMSKIILEDFYFTICFIGTVNIWRGVWNLLNVYLYPGTKCEVNVRDALLYLIMLITSTGQAARDFFSYHERAIYQNLFLPFKVRLGHNMAIIPFKVSLG